MGRQCRRATPSTGRPPRSGRRSSMSRWSASRRLGWSGSRPAPGGSIESVESHGKHLEIEWDDGVILHTHMRMSGSWHLYREGENWQRPHHHLRALVEVDGVARRVLQRSRRRDLPRARRQPPPRARRARARPQPRRRRPRALRRAAARLRRSRRHRRRGAARPARLLRARQRLPVRGPARRAAQPVRQGRRPARAPTPCASSTSPPRCCGPTSAAAAAARRRSPGVKDRLAVYGRIRSAVPALPGDRSSPAAAADQHHVLYWCPGCQVRFDPRRNVGDDTQWMPTTTPTATRRPASSPPTRPGAAPADPSDGHRRREAARARHSDDRTLGWGSVSAAPCGG